jgi:rSAM/selenodomain-associated transferase 1
MNRHLVVFVKAPRLGTVKTRLARSIGDLEAGLFYRRLTAQVLRRLHGPWRLWLAVTPDRFAREGRFWPADLPRRPQGGGDIGARMARPIAELPTGPVVIVGSDIPELAKRHVSAAFRVLGTHDAVFGPARDGGYWLVGLRRRPSRAQPFARSVRWSSPHALADTLRALGPTRRHALLEALSDIDTAEDHDAWLAREQATRMAGCRSGD